MIVNINKDESEKLQKLLSQEDTKAGRKLIRRLQNAAKTIKPRSAKRKGLDWQKNVCRIISNITGIKYDQADDSCEIHSRESGLSGADIILRGKAKAMFPYSVECKNAKTISLPEWIRQAESNCDGLDNWLLAVKSSSLGGRKIIVMSMASFEQIMTAIIDLKGM